MNHKGFTLIELLVSIAILLLLLGMGISNYISFNDRQKLTQAAELIREVVESAQVSARSGKMRGCSSLVAYQIDFYNDNGTGVIEVKPRCSDGSNGSPDELKTLKVSGGVSFLASDTLYSRSVTGIIDDDLDPANEPEITSVSLESAFGEMVISIHRSGVVRTGEIEAAIEQITPSPTPLIPVPTDIIECCPGIPGGACAWDWWCNPSTCIWECIESSAY